MSGFLNLFGGGGGGGGRGGGGGGPARTNRPANVPRRPRTPGFLRTAEQVFASNRRRARAGTGTPRNR